MPDAAPAPLQIPDVRSRKQRKASSFVFQQVFIFLQRRRGGAGPSFEQLSHKINTAPFSSITKIFSIFRSNKYRIYQDFSVLIYKNTKTTRSFVILSFFSIFFYVPFSLAGFSLKLCSTNSKTCTRKHLRSLHMIHRLNFFFFLLLLFYDELTFRTFLLS